jgi:hypothetical protein
VTERANPRPTSARKPAIQARAPGVISIQELYRIEEAKARLGWSDSALRAAKRRGLQVIVCGKRRYVTGNEIFRFLESRAPTPSS